MESQHDIWQKQNNYLQKIKEKNPELFVRKTLVDSDATLKLVGINGLPTEKPSVYLRLWPQDFIVEEIGKNDELHLVEYKHDEDTIDSDGLTVYADLVKAGVSTLDVIDELSKNHKIDRRFVGYAGIKDRDAITSQLISFRNISVGDVKNIRSTNFFLKNIRTGKGAIQIGDLAGNRFTLVLRGDKPIDKDEVLNLINEYKKTGFWNFFYTQRFGTPRLISHYLGLLLLKCQYEEVVKNLLTFQTDGEIELYKNVRADILSKWRDWGAIRTILLNLPYSFRRELNLISHLEKYPTDFLGALKLIPDQVQLWIFAYASFVFNRKLSFFIKSNASIPEVMPLFLSRNPADWEYYSEYLKADGLAMPSDVFRDFPEIQLKERSVNTRQDFEFHGFEIIPDDPKIAVICFSLPKGSYATTMLAHFFALSGNVPVLPNISITVVDSKQILGNGSIAPVVEIFKGVINSKLEIKEETESSE
jgi:TruD family tRNA pseudouridine synthase